MDKSPKEVTTEIIVHSKQKLTHPEKIVYAEENITKQMIFDYYEMVAPYLLPYIEQRCLTLVRCPNHYQHCFYQKHIHSS